jgi:hypothetical protein
MPPVSQAQRGLFRKAAADPAFRQQKGISLSVAQDFNNSDPGGKLPKKVKKKKRAPSGGGSVPFYAMPKRHL